MSDLLVLREKPIAETKFMIAGWHQWADAGAISSELPRYLIERTRAKKIGEIRPDGFYLFQVPGTHHFLRPQIKLQEGYRQSMSARVNEFFYAGNESKGLVIFLGEEPHLNEEQYAVAFLDAAESLGVRRVVTVGGVYGAMPYDKEREISCVYSLPGMKDELTRYAVRFSDYEGGTTIGGYMADRAEQREVELVAFNGFVPAYDFSHLSSIVPGIRIENDFKAWYDLMRRIDHMFDLDLDLTDLQQRSDELRATLEAKLEELDTQLPELDVKKFLERLNEDFVERPFTPLDDVWKKGLEDIFKDMKDW